jgi:hypothetical protein
MHLHHFMGKTNRKKRTISVRWPAKRAPSTPERLTKNISKTLTLLTISFSKFIDNIYLVTNRILRATLHVKAWLTNCTFATAILISFCSSQHFAVQHLYLSSISVFQLSICTKLTDRYCQPIANASTLCVITNNCSQMFYPA